MVDKKLALDGVLSQACKLIRDSGTSSDSLQSLFSSGLFATLLRCPEPHKVDKTTLRGVLRIGDKRSVETLCNLCHQKLNQAAQAREKDSFGYTNNWFKCMNHAAKLLRAIYLKSEQSERDDLKRDDTLAIWRLLRDMYQAEAASFLLIQAYNHNPHIELAHPYSVLENRMKKQVPCYVCGGRGHFWDKDSRPCKACNGSKLLAVSQIDCPYCFGTGRGTAWASSPYGFDGLCGPCEGGKIWVDSFNKQISRDVMSILGLPPIC